MHEGYPRPIAVRMRASAEGIRDVRRAPLARLVEHGTERAPSALPGLLPGPRARHALSPRLHSEGMRRVFPGTSPMRAQPAPDTLSAPHRRSGAGEHAFGGGRGGGGGDHA
jgi:hypothetical protein